MHPALRGRIGEADEHEPISEQDAHTQPSL
jgi:hypothetical protein